MERLESINNQIHPRAFAAFGEELVTSDNYAVLELVKASLGSLFRENIMWAVMINSCRLGMPVRDVSSRAEVMF